MRPQHDDHDGRPSPRTQPPKPDLWTDTQTFFLDRIREERTDGETGRHRLAKSAKPADAKPTDAKPTGSMPVDAMTRDAMTRDAKPRDAKAGDEKPRRARKATGKAATAEATQLATESAERYLTPAGPLTPGVAPVRTLHGSAKAGRVVALGLIALLGVSVVASQRGTPAQLDNAAQQLADRNSVANAADRFAPRVAESTSASPAPSATVSATPSPSPTVKKVVTSVKPVAGLDQKQMNNALTVVKTGQQLGVAQRGLLVGIMTAMQESDLYNQASSAVPESLDYPHEGSSVDYDSCGLFQQRTSMGWGTVKQIMNTTYSSTKFFQALKRVSGWQNMELTLAAQAVQGSAYPYAYAKHEATARKVLTAILAAL
ncbi:hypothetical protein HDA40_003097 [Hamadaea flava]|uniref:Peptidase M23 n=1 Tax=Hamadaea flava TaxID=1742688 RepID=A0ABV8LYN1_9ACTN|nr:hypothetical protein [Hamadaea flava]MCP2324590.1 hypothetical protein [Hamadaea flava]